MTNIVPLNSETHRSLRVYGGASARYGDNQRFAQVVVGEFSELVVHYPILLSKDADTGAFFCGAMLGFDRNEIISRLRYWPLSPFRISFGYTNYGITTGAQAAANAENVPWDWPGVVPMSP